jgi:hypothetical protein
MHDDATTCATCAAAELGESALAHRNASSNRSKTIARRHPLHTQTQNATARHTANTRASTTPTHTPLTGSAPHSLRITARANARTQAPTTTNADLTTLHAKRTTASRRHKG